MLMTCYITILYQTSAAGSYQLNWGISYISKLSHHKILLSFSLSFSLLGSRDHGFYTNLRNIQYTKVVPKLSQQCVCGQLILLLILLRMVHLNG